MEGPFIIIAAFKDVKGGRIAPTAKGLIYVWTAL